MVWSRRTTGIRKRDRGHDQRDDADRDVDEEDPAPAGAVGEEATEHRAEHARRTEHRTEVAAVATALTRRDDVAHGRERQREQAAAAETLDGAEGDQLLDVLRQPGQQRADQEGHDRGLEDQLAAVEVGDLSPERSRGGLGQQIRRDDPAQLAQAAELAGDAGERGADDGLVEGGEEHAGHQAAHHDQDLLVGQIPVGVGGLGLGHHQVAFFGWVRVAAGRGPTRRTRGRLAAERSVARRASSTLQLLAIAVVPGVEDGLDALEPALEAGMHDGPCRAR